MKVTKTKYVNHHHTNQDYTTLLVYFMNEDLTEYDPSFQMDRSNRWNWCPKDDEIITLCLEMLTISPTFLPKLQRALEDKTDYRLTVPIQAFI